MIRIKTKDEIKRIAESCYIVREVFNVLPQYMTAGNTTQDLAGLAEEIIRKHKGWPAFKGYRGFPGSICVSIDSEVVHGIPGDRKLEEGQVVSVDVGVEKGGYFGDAARSFGVGKVADHKQILMEATDQALLKSIQQARPGNRVRDISITIQRYVEERGFSVVRDLVGHGVGVELHEEPQIPNFAFAGNNPRLKPGMTLAIEPMVNEGDYKVKVLADGWTVVTADGACSAHSEDTVVICDEGPRNLTRQAPIGII